MSTKKNKDKIKKEITDILKNVDNVAEKSKWLNDVAGEYQKARDLYFKGLKNEKSANKMQCIMDVLNFVIKDGSLNEMMSGTTGDGKPWSYPDISKLNHDVFLVIENELLRTKSIKLKARYADFLWLTKKDYKKAKIAVDSYLSLIKEYEAEDKKKPDDHFGLDVLESFKRALQISKSISYKYSTVVDELKRLVFEFNFLSSSKAKLTIDLVEIALENRKDFKDKTFWEDLINASTKQSDKLSDNKQWYFSREYIKNIKKIEELMLKKKSDKWDILIAESFVSEADDHKSRKSFAELSILINAIEEYKKLKNYKKIEELKKRYMESSKNVEFHEVSTKIDVSDIISNAKKRATKISKLKPEDIIGVLLISQNLFPNYDEIERIAKKNSKKFISHIFGRSIFDRNMNQARVYSSDQERLFAGILEQFGFSMSFYRYEIEILMMHLITKRVIKWKDFVSFFKKNSWLGLFFDIKDKKGKVILKTRKIIDLITPGAKLYFKTVQKNSKNSRISPDDVMLATDSLVFKIEGIIREMYKLLGKPTFISRKQKGNKYTTYEKNLNDFLNDDFTESLFGKDLVLVMKYLLTEPAGHNLRNNIGHCLIQKENYSILNLHMLFLIIIRLGNYKLNPVN